MEAHRLRVKDLVIERAKLIVRDAKGGKDRVQVLPAAIIAPIREHLAKLFDRFRRQRKLREPGVSCSRPATTSARCRNCWNGYSVIRRLWLYYAGSPDIFSFNFSELSWPTPHHQIHTSSIPLVWCWAS
jgi:integrase